MTRLVAASLATALPLGALSGCGSAQGQEIHAVRGAVAQVTPADPRPFARADTVFGLNLMNAWCKKDPRANVVLSPSSVASGLGMVHLGARGATAKAMARALALPTGDPLPGLRARSRAMKEINGGDVTLHTTDQVWSDKRNPPGRDYLDRVATAYDAGLNMLDVQGDPDGARRTVNEAVEKSTKGQIRDLLPEGAVTEDLGWILTDAVYLKARWESEFKRSGTGRTPFTTADARTVQAATMNRTGQYGLARVPGWTAVDMPYRGGRLSMTALLPDKAAACPRMEAATLGRLAGALKPARVDLTVPKVELRSRADLKDLLTGLGMGVAFSGDTDLTGISPKAARLAFVRHAASLIMDERGTEAAAATGAGVGATSAAPTRTVKVVFDRPYVLLVRDTRTGQPLFLATVADPSRS
ncbi:serpin family protein [Spirillospora sp. NPDC127200]